MWIFVGRHEINVEKIIFSRGLKQSWQQPGTRQLQSAAGACGAVRDYTDHAKLLARRQSKFAFTPNAGRCVSAVPTIIFAALSVVEEAN
jgi:hypothetical protein